jgi:hypothetical protein
MPFHFDMPSCPTSPSSIRLRRIVRQNTAAIQSKLKHVVASFLNGREYHSKQNLNNETIWDLGFLQANMQNTHFCLLLLLLKTIGRRCRWHEKVLATDI